MPVTEHHVWCSNWNKTDECSGCKDLREKYPELDNDPDGLDLAEKYFPESVPLIYNPKPMPVTDFSPLTGQPDVCSICGKTIQEHVFFRFCPPKETNEKQV